jgi:hypothetical protein
MDPAGERDGLPDVDRAQFVAMMRAFHVKIRQCEHGFWQGTRRISK